jgi:hypothetical protein
MTIDLQKLALENVDKERKKLLQECQQLLILISNHPYCLRMLLNAKSALLMILNYKKG